MYEKVAEENGEQIYPVPRNFDGAIVVDVVVDTNDLGRQQK